MQGCANDTGKLIGKVAVLRMALGCADTVPALSEWKRLGAMTTKGFDYSMNTVTSEADDTKGLVENLVNNMDFTISGEGEFRKKDKTTEVGAIAISKYIFDEVQAGRQPSVWVRFDLTGEDAGTYIMGYFNTTSGLVISAPLIFPPSPESGKLLMQTQWYLRSLHRRWRLPLTCRRPRA